MADFDFDEIDKAVTGALGKKAPVSDDTIEPVIVPEPTKAEEAPSTETISSESGDETPKITSVATPVAAAPSTAPAIRRSSGRFMDMVHPQSDMRSSGHLLSKPVPSSPAPIEPIQSIDEVFVAQESPFLPDTKVEKRPLGGSPSSSQPDDAELLENLLDAPDTPLLEAETMPDPIDFAIENGHVDLDLHLDTKHEEKKAEALTTEPQESAEAVQAIENVEEFAVEEKQEASEELSAEPQSKPEPIVEAEKPTDSNVESKTETAAKQDKTHDEPTELKADEPTGPTSITQQYKEHTSTTAESGAIFDTEAYHQPLAQSVKKKSSILVIAWILLLVILGAGAGAAFYLYILPML